MALALNRYVSEAEKNWHLFYKRNQDHFYKDRHYLHVVFPELAESSAPVRLLEVGCGVGNAAIPLLEVNSLLSIVAIDFARSAVDIVKEHISTHAGVLQGRLEAHQCDVTKDDIPVPSGSCDFVLCMFVLSAIAPEVTKPIFPLVHTF